MEMSPIYYLSFGYLSAQLAYAGPRQLPYFNSSTIYYDTYVVLHALYAIIGIPSMRCTCTRETW